jgi:TPR repeat protein
MAKTLPCQQLKQGTFEMASSFESAQFLINSRMEDAAMGDEDALFELGIAYSSGSGGVAVDLVQAHKWFNLAGMSGHERAHECRAEIADDMSAREIAEAQRQARAWLMETTRRAA